MTARLAIVMFLIAGPAPAAWPLWPSVDAGGSRLENPQTEQAANPASEDAYAKPLTKQQIRDLVAAGMNSAKLAPIVVRRGIDFDPTPADLAALRRAGATEALIKALGDAPQFSPPASVPPDRGVREVAPAPPSRESQPASSGSAPLDKLKLLRLVVRETPNARILDLIETAGLDFTPTDEFLDTLQIAGADEAVRAAVGSLAPSKSHAPANFSAASRQPETARQVDNEKDRIYQAGEDITPPKGIYTPAAPYTEQARRQRIEGTVALDIIVEPSGNVSDLKVAESLDPGLDASAVKTVRNWRFEPATRDGRAARVAVHVEISFKLRESQKP
ncbi:MAG TPA: TonB family protein [Terriglobia bacterium]|nr:TonB family protein [Terriglobia bacterium]